MAKAGKVNVKVKKKDKKNVPEGYCFYLLYLQQYSSYRY